ncbi:MAG TPA: hypothetical protein VE031_04935 [Chthoniobacterales bacterium]|nr:hypothetical protein [Chthoniobacterales bacterium]
MPVAAELEPITLGIWIWRFYDPAIKADLFSTAIKTSHGIYLVDPVPLAPDATSELSEQGAIAGIVVTNENHGRAADDFARRFQVEVYDRGSIGSGLGAISIEGGPAGEIAVYCDADHGTLIIGDALINFEPHGFTLLPSKYCSNAKLMRKSLPKLLDYQFERMLFAHGTPILTAARQRLEQLLLQR